MPASIRSPTLAILHIRRWPKRPDSYQHRFPLDASLFARDNPVMARLFADIARRGTVLDATLHVYREVEAAAREQRKPPLCTVALAGRLTNQAYRSGVPISAGTDGDTPISDPLPSLVRRARTAPRCCRHAADGGVEIRDDHRRKSHGQREGNGQYRTWQACQYGRARKQSPRRRAELPLDRADGETWPQISAERFQAVARRLVVRWLVRRSDRDLARHLSLD